MHKTLNTEGKDWESGRRSIKSINELKKNKIITKSGRLMHHHSAIYISPNYLIIKQKRDHI